MENPIKKDDLGVPPIMHTPSWSKTGNWLAQTLQSTSNYHTLEETPEETSHTYSDHKKRPHVWGTPVEGRFTLNAGRECRQENLTQEVV